MIRALLSLGFIALLSGAAYSQPAEAPLAFTLADVHPTGKTSIPVMQGGALRGGRYELHTATMVDLVGTAYGVDADKVLGGPNWLEMDRFEVIAKSAANATPEQQKLMLRTLLADRFGLVVHKETRGLPAYALAAGKGSKLKQADGSGESACNFTVENGGPPPPGGTPGIPTIIYACRNMTMAAFAQGLRTYPAVQQYLGDYGVADKTGMDGQWDFNFKYTVRVPNASGETITIFDAMEKQLGLKLELGKIDLPVMVVDSVNRKPTPNLPEVAKALPPPPTEFEVVDIKPSDPAALAAAAAGRGGRGGNGFQSGGRLDVRGITLKNLIQIAWDLSGPEYLAGDPKWLESDQFDIVAKAPASTVITGPQSQQTPPIDIDTLRLMVRAMLVDRFTLTTHYEDRPVAAYTLLSVKPKIKKAEPNSRTRYKEGPATPDAKDPRNTNPALSRLVAVQNMTMPEFAVKLQTIAPGYIHSPVVDATGLDGGWDFTLSFSPAGQFQGGGGGRGGDGAAAAAGAPDAVDPGSGLTLFEAIEKQLGLKLEMQKRPMQVLVIDHIERKPTEN